MDELAPRPHRAPAPTAAVDRRSGVDRGSGAGRVFGAGGIGDGIRVGGAAGTLGTVIEAVPGAVSLAPASMAPVLGAELGVDAMPSAVGARRRVGSAGTLRAAVLDAGPLAVAGLSTNGASVVVTILLARLLSTRGYGALNQLNGLFLVVSMPGSAVIVAVVRRVTAWAGGGTTSRVQQWGRRLHRRGTAALAAFAVVVLAAGPWLAGVLGQPHTAGLVAMVLAGAVWILLCLDRGLLQAHRRYRALSANLLVEGGMRTAGVLVLVGAGLGVAGAACGILVAEAVTAVHARVTADRAWGHGEGPGGVPPAVPSVDRPPCGVRRRGSDRRDRRTLLVDLTAALVALATVAWLQNVDVIVMGREAPSVSGAYAAVSVASKALVLGAVVLGGYLLPEAAIRWRAGGHAIRELGVTLLFLVVPAAILLAISLGAPRLLLRVVFSSRYLGADAAFAPLVVAMVCLSVTVMLTMYLLAVGHRRVAALLVAGAAAATAAVVVAHGSALGTARADLEVQALLTAAVLCDFASVHRRRLR